MPRLILAALYRSLIFLALLTPIGCVTFSDLPPPAPRTGQIEIGDSLRVFIQRDNDPNEQSGYWTPYPAQSQIAMAIETLRESIGSTAVVETQDPATADLLLHIERWRRLHGFGPITILSAALIPSRYDLHIKIKMTRMRSDAVPKTCVRIHRYRQWVQLFLLPFMPGRTLGNHERSAVARLTARCVFEVFSERTTKRESP